MGLWDNILLALAGLKANKMRALLTMLGIIIGISSVITISTISNIMTSKIEGIFDDFGGLGLIGLRITKKDDAVRDFPTDEDRFSAAIREDIAEKFKDKIDYISFSSGHMDCLTTAKRTIYEMTLYGVNPAYINEYSFEMAQGHFIIDSDCEKASNVCVISDRQAKKIFGSEHNAIGKTLTVTEKNTNTMFDYTVVGVYEYKTDAISAMMLSAVGNDLDSWNSDVYIPYTTINHILGKDDFSNYINVHIISGLDIEKTSAEIRDYLNMTHYRNNDTYKIRYWTQESEMDMFGSVLDIVSGVISVIAGISLLVGGIGVMNIMLVSVTERTKEIGVRKALGAPNSAIRAQFIIESMIICLIGGLLGILLGIGVGNIVGIVMEQAAVPNIKDLIISVLFSMMVGVFFGYYPANKAAKLDPIEALRYE